MPLTIRPIEEQVIFITAATTGIGLATIHRAVEQGAKIFMVGDHEDELQDLQDDLRRKGYETAYAVADVAEYEQLMYAADTCLNTFGRIDTFINNVGVTKSSLELDVLSPEIRKIFDNSFWGVVNGCLIAKSLMQESGGIIMNVGNGLSQVASPVQSIYLSCKDALITFSQCFRKELVKGRLPLHLTIVLPSDMDTPYPRFRRKSERPLHIRPLYDADNVSRYIIRGAEHPISDIGMGPSSRIMRQIDRMAPRLKTFLKSRTEQQMVDFGDQA